MVHLQNWRLKCFFYGNHSVNREIVGTTHPLANFCFALTKHLCQVFLAQVALHKNLMDSVNYLERERNSFSRFGINVPAALLQNSTPFHLC